MISTEVLRKFKSHQRTSLSLEKNVFFSIGMTKAHDRSSVVRLRSRAARGQHALLSYLLHISRCSISAQPPAMNEIRSDAAEKWVEISVNLPLSPRHLTVGKGYSIQICPSVLPIKTWATANVRCLAWQMTNYSAYALERLSFSIVHKGKKNSPPNQQLQCTAERSSSRIINILLSSTQRSTVVTTFFATRL